MFLWITEIIDIGINPMNKYDILCIHKIYTLVKNDMCHELVDRTKDDLGNTVCILCTVVERAFARVEPYYICFYLYVTAIFQKMEKTYFTLYDKQFPGLSSIVLIFANTKMQGIIWFWGCMWC